MDHYYIVIFTEEGPSSTIEISSQRKKAEEQVTSPYVEWLLQTTACDRHSLTLNISTKPGKKCLKWDKFRCERRDLQQASACSVSYSEAADKLLELADEFPTRGSFVLDVIWVMRNSDVTGSLKELSPLLGAMSKLCSWDGGRLLVVLDSQPTERTLSIISFIDVNASILVNPPGEKVVVQAQLVVWRGTLNILSQGTTLASLPGFLLCRNDTTILPEISVVHTKEAPAGGTQNDSFSEVSQEHVWLDPCINVLEYIDVTTVPFFFFTGKKFLLRYHHDDRLPGSYAQVERLQEMLQESDMSGFFCSMYYAISKTPFDTAPECSSKKWKEAVKAKENLQAPKFKFSHKLHTLHFVIMEAEEDVAAPAAAEGKHMQFTAYLLHHKDHLNLSIVADEILKQNDANGKEIDANGHVTLDQIEGLPQLNPSNLLHKDENFNHRFMGAVKHWTDENGNTKIPVVELRRLAQEVSSQLNHEQDKVLGDFTNAPDWFWKGRQSHGAVPDEQELQLQALKNLKIVNDNDKLAKKTKTSEGTRGTLWSSKSTLDMHMKPFDVLKHFNESGEPKNSDPLITASGNDPSPSKLKSFDEAMKLSYHGITYNIDEQAAEKRDRMCRRLVERQVKFETSSIGSSEKVPSPATLNIADSPVRRSSLGGNGKAATDAEKRKQLQKVAEKLYKKRIQSRASVSSERPRPTTSMVLRSTPTKAKGSLSRRSSAMSLRSASTSENDRLMGRRLKSLTQIPSCSADSSEEEKRMRRRSYVQDNKKRLNDIITQSLVEHGVEKDSRQFAVCSKRLYNVSMAFLKELKTSKDLNKIMKETVSNNVASVVAFNPK